MLALRPPHARLGRGSEVAATLDRPAELLDDVVESQACDASDRELARLTVRAGAEDNTGLMAVPRITKEDLKQQLESGASPVLVDARLKYPYEHSTVRLPGAIRYPPDGSAPSIPKDRLVVVYDSDPNELSSSGVAAALIRQGYRASALKGGIVEWLEAKLPTETKQAPQMAPPAPGALKG
jgi:rhodanese-related sulfurtransferase